MITKVKPATWGSNELLTSSQMNLFDTKLITALDKTSAGDALSGPITLTGAGRLIASPIAGAVSGGTVVYHLGDGTTTGVIRVAAAGVANTQYTLANNTPTPNNYDTILVYCEATFGTTYEISIADQGGSTLYTLGNKDTSDGTWCEFIYLGGWHIFRQGQGSRTRFQTFTAAGNGSGTNVWVCPPGVTSVILTGCGGGGGGASGYYTATIAQNRAGSGGGGGGGALLGQIQVAVTPGVSYTAFVGTGGAGGTGGAAHNPGTDGTDTTFGSLACFYGAQGGADTLSTTGAASSDIITPGGACVRGAPRYSSSQLLASATSAPPGAGPACGGTGHWSLGWVGTAGVTGLATGSRNPVGTASSFVGGSPSGVIGATNGSGITGYYGGGVGGGGGAGPFGSGGVSGGGGDGSATNGGSGADGVAAAANTGAGGGGGGSIGFGGTTNGTASGNGGGGGSGKLTIMWVK